MPPGFYLAQWVDVAAGTDERRASTFAADASHSLCAGRVPEAEVAEVLARGAGPQGAAAAYLLDTGGSAPARGPAGPSAGTAGRLLADAAVDRGPYRCNAWTISCVTFLASPKSIMVFGRKNSSLSTPA